MPIDVVWDDEAETIIRWNFSDPWNWQEFRAAFEKSMEIGGHLPYRVDVIPYLANSRIPVPTGALGEFNRIARTTPKNVGLVVITGGNVLTRTIIDLFTQVYGKAAHNWHTIDSLDKARAMIADDRVKRQNQV
jgi:hypothetical protein